MSLYRIKVIDISSSNKGTIIKTFKSENRRRLSLGTVYSGDEGTLWLVQSIVPDWMMLCNFIKFIK